MKLCQSNIEFLHDADQDILRQLFYRARQKFFEPGQNVFTIGQQCTEIMVLQSGVIDIVLSDGYTNHETLDSIGKGSIIGANMVLKQEKWPYLGVNNSPETVKALCINS